MKGKSSSTIKITVIFSSLFFQTYIHLFYEVIENLRATSLMLSHRAVTKKSQTLNLASQSDAPFFHETHDSTLCNPFFEIHNVFCARKMPY